MQYVTLVKNEWVSAVLDMPGMEILFNQFSNFIGATMAWLMWDGVRKIPLPTLIGDTQALDQSTKADLYSVYSSMNREANHCTFSHISLVMPSSSRSYSKNDKFENCTTHTNQIE